MKKQLFFLLVCVPTLFFAQHSIQGTFSPTEDFTYAFLYKSTPNENHYIGSFKKQNDSTNLFKIELDSTKAPGIYKVVYATPPDNNNFSIIYDGKEDISFTFNKSEGVNVISSNENNLWYSYSKSMDLINHKVSDFYANESTDEIAFQDIFKTLKDTQNAFEDAAKGTLALQLIEANRSYIPKEFETLSTYLKNLKATYLTHIDFGNEFLQSSDFLNDRVKAFIFSLSENADDITYKKNIDDVMRVIGDGNLQIKTSLLEIVWNRMTELNNEAVANYITKTYLQDLAQQTNSEGLLRSISAYKNSAIGVLAQDFSIPLSEDNTTTLHNIDVADQYVLIFWRSTCGHCLDQLPKVKTLLEKHAKHTKVIAFAMEDDEKHWQKKITEFPEFIHVLGLEKWNNPVGITYGINATPTYFILNKNKHIIAKPQTIDELSTFLNDSE